MVAMWWMKEKTIGTTESMRLCNAKTKGNNKEAKEKKKYTQK